MTAHEVAVVRRKRRRTHLYFNADGPACGTRTATTNASVTPLPLIGGATVRLKNDLVRELDGNTCIPCTRIANSMLALYVSRDMGRAW